MRLPRLSLYLAVAAIATSPLVAQVAPPVAAPLPTLPPATKLEGFKPEAGSVVTFGYDDIKMDGGFMFNAQVTLDARELRSSSGGLVRGVVVEVRGGQYRDETSFVDADELPELLRGIAALLEVKANPTPFKSFEVRYQTRGDLRLSAYNNAKGGIEYGVAAGRRLQASVTGLNGKQIEAFRGALEQARVKLASLPEK